MGVKALSKKIYALLLSLMLCVAASGCNSEETPPAGDQSSSAPAGILAQVRLGMAPEQIQKIQESQNMKLGENVTIYYDSDTVLWSENNDTDLYKEVSALIPEESQYYYIEPSVITYYFTEAADEMKKLSLNSYSEEVRCLIDKDKADEYFGAKSDALKEKHGAPEGIEPFMTGTPDMDMTLSKSLEIDCPSYKVAFNMTLEYDTVDGVSDYYGKYMSVTITEKAVKDPIAVT